MDDENDFVVVGEEQVQDYQNVDIPAQPLDVLHKIQAWLDPTDYLSPGNEYMKHLNAYVKGTGEWLRKTDQFQQWHDSYGKGCFWVKGVPGAGKSVFAASTAKQLGHLENAPVLFFFFRQIVATNHDPQYLVRDWLCQLLLYSPLLQLRLMHLSSSVATVGKVPAEELWKELCSALDALPKAYCIADALDEMDDNHEEFIHKLINLGQRRPKSIKVLLTSRPIPRLEALLRHQSILSARLEPSMIYPDIVTYLDARLSALEPRLSPDKNQKVRDAICDRAKGLFLHARLMTDNLTEGLRQGTIVEETLPTSLERLPKNLKDLYTSMLAEHSRRSGVSKEFQFGILQWVTHSSRPLRLLELGAIISFMRENTSLKDGKDLARASCGRLLEILDDETVSVIHHSFTEFLIDEDRKADEESDSGFPVIRGASTHTLLVTACLQYLEACQIPDDVVPRPAVRNQLEWAEDEDSEDEADEDEKEQRKLDFEEKMKTLRLRHPFMDYAINCWNHHASKMSPYDSRAFAALSTYLDLSNPAFRACLRIKWPSRRQSCISSLHIAAFIGLKGYLETLISQGVSVDVYDDRNMTPLSYAAVQGHELIAEYLLDRGANPDSADRTGSKPLHYATGHDRLEVTKLLLARGVSPLTANAKTGETPLQYACQRGCSPIITQFLPFLGVTELCRALEWTVRSRHQGTTELILKTGKVPVNALLDGITALAHASAGHELGKMEILTQYGADPNTPCTACEIDWDSSPDRCVELENPGKPGISAIHAWAGAFHTSVAVKSKEAAEKCLKLLLRPGGDINARDHKGKTPLHYAVRAGDQMSFDSSTPRILTELLLENGADPAAMDDQGQTPLHVVHRQAPAVVDVLVRYGALVNAVDKNGSTPLHTTIGSHSWLDGTAEKVALRLLAHKADCKITNDSGNTAFHYALSCPNIGTGNFVTAIVESGVNMNAKNIQGETALHMLHHYPKGREKDFMPELVANGLDLEATNGPGHTALFHLIGASAVKPETLQSFIDLGSSLTPLDSRGKTMLHCVVEKKLSWDIYRVLIDAGADPKRVDSSGNTLVHEVAKMHWAATNSYDGLDRLEKMAALGIPTDSKNLAGQTPLHLACGTVRARSGHNDWRKEFIDFFLDGKNAPKSDVDAADSRGARPIHYAATTSEYQVSRLLAAGADPTVRTYNGVTPLHAAATARQSNVVGLLLSAYQKGGVLSKMIEAEDDRGRTALHRACLAGRPESVSYLLKHGANASAKLLWSGITPLHLLAEFPIENALWDPQIPEQTTFPPSYVERPRATESEFFYGGSIYRKGNCRTKDIFHLLSEAGADIAAETMDDKKQTPMDNAVKTGCAELVHELRLRGCKAKDEFLDALIPPPRGTREAQLLLSQVLEESPRKSQRAFTTKFLDILLMRDYNLLKEFFKGSPDLELREQARLEVLQFLLRWGHWSILEVFADDLETLEKRNSEENEESLLHSACATSLPNMEVIKFLVDKLGVDVNTNRNGEWLRHKLEGGTPLHRLAAGEHFWNAEALEYLVKAGGDVEALNKAGETPLAAALSSQWPNGFWKESTIRVLLTYGANPNAVDAQGLTCLDKSDHPALTSLLIEHGADINRGSVPVLCFAAAKLDASTVKILLEKGADPNTPLPPAKGNQSWDSAWMRVQNPEVGLLYPLHHAALARTWPKDWKVSAGAIMSRLLESGADPSASYEDGSRVIHHILEENGPVDRLLELPSLHLEQRGQGGRTLLLSACFSDPPTSKDHKRGSDRCSTVRPRTRPEEALTMIEMGANTNAVDDAGRSALHWLCVTGAELQGEQRVLLQTLLEKSPRMVLERDNEGCTPLHLAVQRLHLWTVDRLLAAGAELNVQDNEGNSPLHFLARRLCGRESDVQEANTTFKRILDLGTPIDVRNRKGETALFELMASGSENIRHRNETMVTHRQVLPLFKQAGADFHVRNNQRETLLHAVTNRRVFGRHGTRDQQDDLVGSFQDLMALGLDPRAEDVRQRTPIDVAAAAGNDVIVQLFRKEDDETAKAAGFEQSKKATSDSNDKDGD